MWSRRLPAQLEPNPWSQRLAELRAAGRTLVDLTEANPTRVGLSAIAHEARDALAPMTTARYEPDPRGLESARVAVAEYYAASGVRVDPDDVVLTASTSEAYAHLMRLCCDPGQRVLAPAPGYPLFEPLADLEGVTLGSYRLVDDGAWSLDREDFARAVVPGTRAVIVVQPNHPTGTWLGADDLDVVMQSARERDLVVIADEVFGDFRWDPPPGAAERRHAASLLAPATAPTAVLSGLSKVCGLPQLKLSWIALAGPEDERRRLREGLEWIADLFLSVATPVQLALPALLATRHAFQTRVRERIAANLATARDVARHPRVDLRPADGGWMAVLRVETEGSDEDLPLRLLEGGVIVHPGHFYDFAGDDYLAVSLIVEPERFAEGLCRIVETVAEAR